MKKPDFSTRIKTAREKEGITLYRAAKNWDFAISTLMSWETGRRKPAGLYKEKLEKALAKLGC
jgi:DNA-binding transcriptional regulator YiaG